MRIYGQVIWFQTFVDWGFAKIGRKIWDTKRKIN